MAYRLWSLRELGPPRRERALPAGTVELVFDLSEPGAPRALVFGPHDRPFSLALGDQTEVAAVHFAPGGAASFLGVPLEALTNAVVPLEALWGAEAEALLAALHGDPDPATRLRRIDAALRARRREDCHPALVPAVRGLEPTGCPVRTGALAERLGLTRRHLTRLVTREVGLAPTPLRRVRRFQHAARLLLEPDRGDGADCAAACGFVDQAHLIHEFQDFAGLTPTLYRRVALRPLHVPDLQAARETGS